jgi:hypothetical protein
LDKRYGTFALDTQQALDAAAQRYSELLKTWKGSQNSLREYIESKEQEHEVQINIDHSEFATEITRRPCPACGNLGMLFAEVTDVEFEYEGPGEVGQYPVITEEFSCPVCDLTLDDTQVSAVIHAPWIPPKKLEDF